MKYHLFNRTSTTNYHFGSFEAVDRTAAYEYAIDWLVDKSYIDPQKHLYHINLLEGKTQITVEKKLENQYYVVIEDKGI